MTATTTFKFPEKIPMIGKKFGYLSVLKEIKEYGKPLYYECVCDCGNVKRVLGQRLRSGHTKSCGCLKSNYKHAQSGKNRSPEYVAWGNMIQRCHNPQNNNYKFYGARGISVCDRWRSFELFLEDMGQKPDPTMTIERKDVNGNYEPSNCIWETRRNQDRNKTSNNRIEYNGRSQIIKDWSEELNVKPPSIKWHLSQGKSFDWIYNYFKDRNN